MLLLEIEIDPHDINIESSRDEEEGLDEELVEQLQDVADRQKQGCPEDQNLDSLSRHIISRKMHSQHNPSSAISKTGYSALEVDTGRPASQYVPWSNLVIRYQLFARRR